MNPATEEENIGANITRSSRMQKRGVPTRITQERIALVTKVSTNTRESCMKKSKAIWRLIMNATERARHCLGIMPDMPCTQPGPN